ncbi:ATP-dependent DNA helicase [Trichonephila clavipes]|uniref:ATP-dependent DNA helicase n=1 Tax=Trichonephila clavipes TaxID=2585209 RepID=A0A8X6W651_TRICX|nr:ATP-dependent DNA helicase [Trichonephila clavipes]
MKTCPRNLILSLFKRRQSCGGPVVNGSDNGRVVPAQVSSSSLDHGSELRCSFGSKPCVQAQVSSSLLEGGSKLPVRGLGEIVVLVAWTGISAVILEGGRTAHSRFKLPVPILDNSSCAVRHNTKEGQFLQAAKIIIWDECSTMTPHHALSAVDRLFRDLMG